MRLKPSGLRRIPPLVLVALISVFLPDAANAFPSSSGGALCNSNSINYVILNHPPSVSTAEFQAVQTGWNPSSRSWTGSGTPMSR
jgi:hypothetical protein